MPALRRMVIKQGTVEALPAPSTSWIGPPVADAGSYTLTPSVTHSGSLGGRKRKTRVAVTAVHSGSGVASKIWAFAAVTANYAV
jgi:hypothetical protein